MRQYGGLHNPLTIPRQGANSPLGSDFPFDYQLSTFDFLTDLFAPRHRV
jgi:hypothetical protein